MSSATVEDQTVEDGELIHSPSDLQPQRPPSRSRPQQEVMDFSLSEDDDTGGIVDDDMDDDEDHLDSLVIKPPQAQVVIAPQVGHQSAHRGNRVSRHQQRDGHGASDRHGASSNGGNRHDKHRSAPTSGELAGNRSKHRDHRERKKHKHYDRDKERTYSKQMLYPVEHQQHQNQMGYGIEMTSHHHQSQSMSNLSNQLSSRSIKEGERSGVHHRSSNSSTNSSKHDSLDRSHHSSSSISNKRSGNSISSRRGGSGNSGRVDHVASSVGTAESEGGDEKQQQADRALRDLRDRLLSKRVVGKRDGERGGSSRSKRDKNQSGSGAARDALEGEAGQLVKEIIDISTSAVQQQVADGDQHLTEEEQTEKEVRRKRLLIAEREMSRQKEKSRQERQERLERIEQKRRLQQLQQHEQRQPFAHDDNMDDIVVVTLSSENSTSDFDEDNDSNAVDLINDNQDRRAEHHVDIMDDDDEEGHDHADSSDESGEHRDVEDISEDDDQEEEHEVKSRDRDRDKAKHRDSKKHGSKKRHGKGRDDRARREKDRGRRRRDSSTDEGEAHTNDAVGGDGSPGAPTSAGDSNYSRDKDRLGRHRDSRLLRRSHSPRLSHSPRSQHSRDSQNRSRSPLSRSRSRSRSAHRTISRHQLLRSSRSRSRSRSPHRKSKTPPTSSNSMHNNKEQAANEKDGSTKKDSNADAVIHIDESLPPYYPAIQGCRPVEEFRCLNRIEEGTYGVVYRAQDKRTREIVALKKLKMEKEKEGFPITSLREINTILKGQHPNIVTVREIVVGSHMDKIFIVMDYVEHDLKSLMETMRSRRQAFSVGEVKCLLKQLLMAVAHLHDNWILHRDLKTSNLLLSHKGVLKVGDFGLAREYGSPLRPYTPIVVTLWYRAPELLLCTKEYSTPVDMWSVGCIMGELVLMNALFPGKSEVEQLTKIFKELGTPNETIWPDYPNLPAVKKLHFTNYPVNSLHNRFPQLTSLGCGILQAFLTYDPKQRITADTALQHDYFSEAPLAIDPAMFPTWPAKSELGVHRARAASPKPPSGGREYKQLGADADDAGFGFRIGISMADSRRLAAAAANAGAGSGGAGGSGGFSLKF